MKRLVFIAVILLMAVGGPGVVADMTDITFSWTPNTEPDLAGYRIYSTTVSGDYSSAVMVKDIPATVAANTGTTTANVDDNFYFTMTAYDSEGLESAYSNECATFIGVPPDTPGGFGCE